MIYGFYPEFIDRNQCERYRLQMLINLAFPHLFTWKPKLNDNFYRMVLNTEFATPFKEISPPELNKYLQNFNLSARKRDGSIYNKKSFTAIQAVLDCHFKNSPFSKLFSIINDTVLSLSNLLKTSDKGSRS